MLEHFRNAPPERQILIAGALAALLCLVAALAFFWFRTDYAVLFTGLRQQDAAAVVQELERKGTPFTISDGGATISVPAADAASARLEISREDLPVRGAAGFELFNNSSIGLTEFAQRINLQRALQGELARTISAMDAVESARVHLSLGEQTVFRGDRRPSRAAVAVTVRRGRRLMPQTVRGIQRLVAGAVPDLGAADVVVLNEQGAAVSAEAPIETAPSGSEGKREAERFFEARVRAALASRFPADALDVSVWASSDPAAGHGVAYLPDGNPAPRDFGLVVRIAVSIPLSIRTEREIRSAAAEAIGMNEALGDSIAVSPAPPDPTQTLGPFSDASSGDRPPAGVDAAASPGGRTWPLAALLLAAAGLGLILLRRRARPRMSEETRALYIRRLRTAFDQRGAHAKPSA